MLVVWVVIMLLVVACDGTVTPGVTPSVTCNPWATFWPTDIVGPEEWGTPCVMGVGEGR